MNLSRYLLFFIFCIFCLFSGCGKTSRADLVLANGKIATVDREFTIHQALAIGRGRILYVGSNQGAKKFLSRSTKVIDLKGKLVVPGMVDSHGHPFNLGKTEDNDSFSVRGSRSYQEVVDRVAEKIKTMKPGEWLTGGGWYQDDWQDNSLPVHDPLSAVSPENPIFLYRRGGNSCLVNQKALYIASITRETPDPYGGKIIRKPNGDPTGVLVNMGNNMVKKHFPKPSRPLSWYEDGYLNAARMCNEVGLTGWHDAGIDPILYRCL